MNSANRVCRRTILTALSSLAVGSVTFRRALAKEAETRPITADMIAEAEWVAGIDLTDEQRRLAAVALEDAQQRLKEFRKEEVQHGLAPAFVFRPLEEARVETAEHAGTDFRQTEVRFHETSYVKLPETNDELAFLPVRELSALLRNREVTSTELTKLYLARLKKFDPLLRCVVSLTEDVALKQAARADREIQAGHYRGPLHGVPWGAKDILSFPNYKTTWGAPLYRDRTIDEKAAVIQRLEDAGAVMLAKLTTGNLAMGDEWFGGKTRNPWNPSQGSSGSSAGSASATSAGLVGFSIGTETMGSIISPSARCGVTGLRPTFGRVSRFGCMSLSWTLDKIGPICRTVEDCAVVLGAIHGHDQRDPSSVSRNYDWPVAIQNSAVRIGYSKEAKEFTNEVALLRDLGFEMVPIDVPKVPHERTLSIILTAECGSIFDALTEQQEPKGVKHWPRTFVMGQFVTANDYIRANRIRRRVMEDMRDLFGKVDVVVGPSMGMATHMSGHPKIALPNGFREHSESKRQVPTSLFMTGRLYEESTLIHVANAYQRATEHHLLQPPIEQFLSELDSFGAAELADPNTLHTN